RPQLLEELLLLERVHARPEAVVAVAHQLAVLHEAVDRLALPAARVAVDVVDGLRLEDEEAAVDPALALLRLLVEVLDPVALERQVAEARRRADGRDGRDAPVGAVERRQAPEVDVGHAVAVREVERLARRQPRLDPLQAPARHRVQAGVDEVDLPLPLVAAADRSRAGGDAHTTVAPDGVAVDVVAVAAGSPAATPRHLSAGARGSAPLVNSPEVVIRTPSG